ncbi:hypothetical protein BFS06_14000 [Clostridium perfringens]|uniref:Uncharacterized protein n=1 Tax=Clostridium perfringens TaxID=1502 RepID=A0A140GRL7_CLOPF|nr:hypothetical protein [Clostridium perfringens]AMN31176.1 hypothetical protein JFP838_pA0260 [Clostridium perfringens]TBX14319.1 hypothetical protein BFS06_14000 [Clostridium perfringens]
MKFLIKISKILEYMCCEEVIFPCSIILFFISLIETIILQLLIIKKLLLLLTLIGVVLLLLIKMFLKFKLRATLAKSFVELIIKSKVKKFINNKEVFNYLVKETYCYDYKKYENCKTPMDYVSEFYSEGLLSISGKNINENLWRKHFFKNYSLKQEKQDEYEKENQLYSLYSNGMLNLSASNSMYLSLNSKFYSKNSQWQEMSVFQCNINKILNYNTEYYLEFRNIANLYILTIKDYKKEEDIINIPGAYKKEINTCYDSLFKKVQQLNDAIKLEYNNKKNMEYNKNLEKIEKSKKQTVFSKRNTFDSYIEMN